MKLLRNALVAADTLKPRSRNDVTRLASPVNNRPFSGFWSSYPYDNSSPATGIRDRRRGLRKRRHSHMEFRGIFPLVRE